MQWEYLIIVIRNLSIGGPESFGQENLIRESTVDELNEYGAEGWELVSLQLAGVEWLAIFKRPEAPEV